MDDLDQIMKKAGSERLEKMKSEVLHNTKYNMLYLCIPKCGKRY